MKNFGLALIILGLLLAVVPATAQEQTSYTLNSAVGNVWHVEGKTGDNPALTVPANTAITVTANNADAGVHNLKIGGGVVHELFEEGATVTETFTSPASGVVKYVCTIHTATMSGEFKVAGSATTDGEKKSPGTQVLGVSIAMIGAALFLARRK